MMTNGKMTCDDRYNEMVASYKQANDDLAVVVDDTPEEDDDEGFTLTMCVCTECSDEIDWDAEGDTCHRCHVGVYVLTEEGKAALMDEGSIAIIDDSGDWDMGQDGGQFV